MATDTHKPRHLVDQNDTGPPREGYSIRVAARLSGISADQLRIWERRYGYPSPGRDAAGKRLYSAEDVERLSLIAQAQRVGYRAKDAIEASPLALQRALQQAQAGPASPQPSARELVDALLGHLKANRLTQLRTELRRLGTAYGPKPFITEIAGPLIRRVGDGWAAKELEVRHEHLLTQALSTQLHLMLAGYEDPPRAITVVLATFPDEQHGLGLQLAALYLAVLGAKPRVLGTHSPVDQIAETALALKARALGISVSRSSLPARVRPQLEALGRAAPRATELWVGGEGANAACRGTGIEPVDTWEKLEAVVARARESSAPG